MVKFKHFLEKFYVAIIFVLLYLPIAVLTVMSFNNSRYMKWGGFTFRWYEDLFTSGPIMEALRNTLLLALLSALIATAVGTLACVGILYMRKRSQSAIMSVNSIPLLNADIVTGIALMLLFVRMFGNLNFTTMLIAHISFNIPYVVLNVLPKLRQRDRNTYEAAVDLGATPVQAFFKVIVPDIFPGILSGFLMAFTMSLDDFTITYFTKGAGIKTLSIIIYTERKLGNQLTLELLIARKAQAFAKTQNARGRGERGIGKTADGQPDHLVRMSAHKCDDIALRRARAELSLSKPQKQSVCHPKHLR